MLKEELLFDLLRQAIKFDSQIVIDYPSKIKWRLEAMEAIGGYNIEQEKKKIREHEELLNRVYFQKK